MQCPKCGREGLRYREKNIKQKGKTGGDKYLRRKSQDTFCRKCGYQDSP